MFDNIKKRDGRIVEFDASKITAAISMAGKAAEEFGAKEAKELTLKVLTFAHETCGPVPEVEEIQDIVERVLLDSPFHKTAKAYILYREQHAQIRNLAIEANVDLVEQYIRKLDWKIKENSNMCYSLQGLNNYISSDVTSEYWLNRIYPPEIRDAHKEGDIHIHDLSQLSVYTYFGKEVILAKHRGELLTLSFEQLYEMAEAKEELLNEKDKAWAKYPKDMFVMDKDGWTRVSRLVRKTKDKPMRFLRNRGGRSIIVTEDHPMITEQCQTEARDVQIGEDTLFTVDMVRRLAQEHLFSEDRIDLVHELRSRGFDGRDGDLPHFNGFPISECSDESDGIVHTLSFCGPRYIRLTEAFGFFVGLALAEGYVADDIKSYVISMSSRNRKDLERANTGLLEHGWSGIITQRNQDGMYEIRIRNRFLGFLFAKVFHIRPGSGHKTLPVGILSYSRDFVRGMVAGVLDGDGAANGKTGIQLRMASRTLLEQLSVVLPFLGLFPRDRNCEGVGSVREYEGRTITQKVPLYGLGFRKMDSAALPSERYDMLEPSQEAWQDETADAWHKVLNNAETEIPDEHIYDITTETHTLVVNGMWNHNCVGWDLKDLLVQGFRGVTGKVESAPPRHFRTALGQLVNFIYTLQGECYSDDTEVLTDNGWKLFRDLDKGNDKVYTLNPETKDIEIQKPLNFFEFENKEMIHFKNSKTDLLVTENHRMLVSKYRPDKDRTSYECGFVKAKDYNPNTHLIPKGGLWKGEYQEYFELPSVESEVYENFNPQKWVKKTIPSKRIKMDLWLRFLGWYLSEGSCHESHRPDKRRNQPRKEYVVRIYQKKYCQELEDVLSELDFNHTRTEAENGAKTYSIHNKQLYMYVSQFGKSADRFIPKAFKNLDVEQLSVLYDALYLGDGLSDTSNGNEEYYTSSKKLADDVQELILKLGHNANIRQKSNDLGSWYVVGASKTLYFKLGKESISRTDCKGKVYCVEVPNHTLYVRRNNKAIWCGNSAGAQAVSNFDTLLAPFVRHDNLNYAEVRQAMQEFVFNSNIPTRVGFQCMSEDTDILTPQGWMGHEDIDVGQIIKTFDVRTGEIQDMPVRKMFSEHYEGKMYNLRNSVQDQLISPGHRVVRKSSNSGDEFVLEEIEKILESNAPVILPITGKNRNPAKKVSDDEIRRLANIIAGSQNMPDDQGKTGETVRCVPEILKNMNKAQARLFLDTYMKAEGHEGSEITTTNAEILNGLEQIAVDAEYGFSVEKRDPARGKQSMYVLQLTDHQDTCVQDIDTVAYSGVIWCPNTDNETVVARRNGKVFVTGNTPFFNITMDLEVPSTLRDHPVIIGGEHQEETYADYQSEMDTINRAFAEIMMEGDATGRVFTFPIPTYNITPEFDWDNPNLDEVWRMTGKFGTPYFSNFVNSDMSPDDARSMCPLHPDTNVIVRTNGKREIRPIGDIYDAAQQNGTKYEVLFNGKWHGASLVANKTKGCLEFAMGNHEKVVMDVRHEQPVKRGQGQPTEILRAKNITTGMYVPFCEAEQYAFCEEGHQWVRIRDIRALTEYSGRVYCFAVDSKDHLFQLGNGMVTHNCRLRLDNRELIKRGGGLFGANPLTGSIGVVSINLPRIGYLSKNENDFFDRLKQMILVAKDSLIIKRKILENFTDKDLYPYSKFYLREVRNATGRYWKNHFSTIGIIGMNEACLNFMGKDIGTEDGLAFSVRTLDFIRDTIVEIQEETDDLFNLEATPAEGTSYRLAMLDRERFPDILCADENKCCQGNIPYYTNSTQLPVNYTDDIFETLNLQDELQTKYTGGTVLHIYLGEMVSDIETVKNMVRKIANNFRLPYFTLTPTFSVCPSHGYLNGEQERCPTCDAETEIYSRIVGYLRPVSQWNKGKQAEYGKRKTFKVEHSAFGIKN